MRFYGKKNFVKYFLTLDKNGKMDITAKKLEFIEKYIQLKNEKLIDKLSSILGNEIKRSGKPKKSIADFFGVISTKEGNDMKNAIRKGCENIDYNEW